MPDGPLFTKQYENNDLTDGLKLYSAKTYGAIPGLRAKFQIELEIAFELSFVLVVILMGSAKMGFQVDLGSESIGELQTRTFPFFAKVMSASKMFCGSNENQNGSTFKSKAFHIMKSIRSLAEA